MNLNVSRTFILLAFALPLLVGAQTETIGRFSQEDNDRMERMLPRTLLPKIKNAFVFPHWIGKSDDFWYLRQIAEGTTFLIVDAATGRSHPAFDHQQIAEAVTKASGVTVSASHLPFDTFEFNPDRSSIHVVVKDKQYDCVLKPAACSGGAPVPPEPLDVTPFIGVPPPVTDPNESLLIAPNKRWAVLTRDNNLWMHDMDTGQERQLTRDGQENCGYGIYIGNFNTASIVRERMTQAGHHLPPMASYWAPDSRTAIVPHVDQRHVADYPYVETVPWDGSFRPKLHLVRIPWSVKSRH